VPAPAPTGAAALATALELELALELDMLPGAANAGAEDEADDAAEEDDEDDEAEALDTAALAAAACSRASRAVTWHMGQCTTRAEGFSSVRMCCSAHSLQSACEARHTQTMSPSPPSQQQIGHSPGGARRW
jgi:hypothetical protein